MSSSESFAWDPDRYLAFTDERGRPFLDLVTRIGAEAPGTVVDLGCGTGNLTSLLARRWPDARVLGVDSSEDMIRAASSDAGVEFVVGDLRDWRADVPVDVLVSNAALQWVPGHLDLLPGLVDSVSPGGWLAFQVPGNFDEPSHTIRAELASEPAYAAHTAGVAHPDAHDAATYLRVLRDLGCTVDAWETTYLHVLEGPDPVFSWVSGTGARPTLQALPDDLRAQFEEEFKRRLREAYPEEHGAVVMPFRRVFVVAQLPTAG
jgi:trans-aconitate 2-methyltransferase